VHRKKGIKKGDTALLLRQHHDRGIVAVGRMASSTIFEGPHWDGSDRLARYVNIDWSVWLELQDRLTLEQLREEIPEITWNRLQASGTQVPVEVEARLEQFLADHLATVGKGLPLFAEEVVGTFAEGAVTRVSVNRFERSSRARELCIKKWGTDCVVCGFRFEQRYGDAGAGFIHVHHLAELSTVGSEYEIRPVDDLRPVCPNCHAMLHKRSPAYTIDELKAMLRPTPSGR
jgi:5-methylcytosine-specific restriction protein A